MPYNNTPISPPKEYSGTVSLPLARIKKIIHADDDLQSCSNNAAFVITIATEMFIQHLVERTHEIIKAEKRSRRNVQYADVANAVARLDNLEFLSDVVPRTTTYAKYTDRKKKQAEAEAEARAVTETQQYRSPIQHFSDLPGPSDARSADTSGQAMGPMHVRHSSNGPVHTNGSGTHHSPHSFQGPGSRSTPINLLDDGDAMDVDQRPASSGRSAVPSTMELLERARAAQARAEMGLSSHSPSQGPPGP